MFQGIFHQDSNPDGVRLTFNDTWSYDYNTNTWTNITSATYPANYNFGSVAYDTESDLVIVFGGTNGRNAYNDPTGGTYNGETWSFDYNTNTWDNITPSVSPVPRTGVNMAYDSEHDLIILFGGYTHLLRTEIDHETWAFDYNTLSWTELNPDSDLERRAYSMAYDSESEKIVLFGGNTGDDPYTFLGDTWVFDYDFNNWTLMPVPEVPDDTNSFFIPTILSFSIIAIVLFKRRNNK